MRAPGEGMAIRIDPTLTNADFAFTINFIRSLARFSPCPFLGNSCEKLEGWCEKPHHQKACNGMLKRPTSSLPPYNLSAMRWCLLVTRRHHLCVGSPAIAVLFEEKRPIQRMGIAPSSSLHRGEEENVREVGGVAPHQWFLMRFVVLDSVV